MTRRLTQEEFDTRRNEIHFGKGYVYLDPYTNQDTKMRIVCPTHGIFTQDPGHHIGRKHGCPICKLKIISDKNKIIPQDALNRCKEKHQELYEYDEKEFLEIKSVRDLIKIKCHKHGWFTQTLWHHLNGSGCSHCKISKGELKIKKFFELNNINFIPQKTFDDCKGKKRKLPFDFYLPKYNLLIEYQGKQHYEIIECRGGVKTLMKIQETDRLKKDYCILKDIRLLEITYEDDVEKVLKEFLCENSPNSLIENDLLEFP